MADGEMVKDSLIVGASVLVIKGLIGSLIPSITPIIAGITLGDVISAGAGAWVGLMLAKQL